MKPLLVKTAHSSGGWKVKVVASKLSPLLLKCASSSSHGKLHAAASEIQFHYPCHEKALFCSPFRDVRQRVFLLVTTEEASALLLVMQSNEAVPTRWPWTNCWHETDLPICCVNADMLEYSFPSWGQNGFSQYIGLHTRCFRCHFKIIPTQNTITVTHSDKTPNKTVNRNWGS